MMQLPLIDWDALSQKQVAELVHEMRGHYWYVRNLRGSRWGNAKLRARYRSIAVCKNKLMLSGVSKREVLDLLACLRLKCCARKQPFLYCYHCKQGRHYSERVS